MTDTLFTLPAPVKIRRPRGKWTQQERCTRCRHGVGKGDGAYCRKHDLCLEFTAGHVHLTKDGHTIKCDGKEWGYA